MLVVLAFVATSSGCNDQGAPSLHALVDKVSDAGAEAGEDQAAARGVEILDESATMRMYYQFVDDSGQVRFVERLEDVPEQWRGRVGFVEMPVTPPLSPKDAQRTRDQRYASRSRPAANAQKVSFSADAAAPQRRAPEILVYYADWCGACKLMKRHLDRKGIDYELRDIDVPDILEELVDKTGAKAIPVIDVEGRILRGYNADALDDLLSETT